MAPEPWGPGGHVPPHFENVGGARGAQVADAVHEKQLKKLYFLQKFSEIPKSDTKIGMSNAFKSFTHFCLNEAL